MSKKAEGSALRFVSVKPGNISRKSLSKVLRKFVKNFERLQQHTVIGSEIVKNISFIPGIENGVLYHHERYDGKGYAGLSGDKIPEAARIIAVADAYEAMSSDRSFRSRLSKDQIIEEFVRGRGTQFDPYIVDVFLDLLAEGLSIDETSVELDFAHEESIGEAGALLRQVFTETVQETQNELEKDSLTGFLNRKYFEEKINNYLLRHNSYGTFFMTDLDNFKSVNDTYGHAAGDTLILAFAEVLRENVRDDDFVCRIGGDEFAIFFPELDKEYVIRQRAENIIQSFSERKEELGYDLCSVSIGIMTKYAGSKAVDYETLYRNADKALYYVKNNGKDDYHLYANMSEENERDEWNAQQLDMPQLLRQITERKYRNGAYAVEYDRFAYIYQFIARNIERSKQQVQLILLSLETGKEISNLREKLEDALMLLEAAIVRSLRRGDVTTRFGTTQQIVVLMGANVDNGKAVADRIVEKYKILSGENPIEIRYDVQEVSVKKTGEEADK